MTCGWVQNHLSAYCDRELTGADMLRIQRHVGMCTACSRELQSVEQVKSLFSSLAPVDPGRPFRPETLDNTSAASALDCCPIWAQLREWAHLARRPFVLLLDTMQRPVAARTAQTALAGACLLAVGAVYVGLMHQPQHADAVTALVPRHIESVEPDVLQLTSLRDSEETDRFSGPGSPWVVGQPGPWSPRGGPVFVSPSGTSYIGDSLTPVRFIRYHPARR